MDFFIRKASMNDYDRINELFWQSDQYHYENEPYIYEKTTGGNRSKEYIETLLNGEENLFIVLEQEGEIIGFLYAYGETKGNLPIHKKRKFLVIDNIVIDESHQRRGYGEKLLDYVIEFAKTRKYNDIVLNVFSFNEKAIKLYAKKEFKILTQEMILRL